MSKNGFAKSTKKMLIHKARTRAGMPECTGTLRNDWYAER